MTEQKPYGYAFFSLWSGKNAFSFTPPDPSMGRKVRPLYEHPAPPSEQKPVAWICEYPFGWGQDNWLTDVSEHRPKECETIRNVRPLYEHPAPSQHATDPAVEAARRKALRYLLDKLEHHSQCSDWAPIVMAFGVLRDLLGQPRKCPEQRLIAGYDEEPDVVVSGPEQPMPVRLSVPMLASIIANRLKGVSAWSPLTVANVAQGVHEAIYGKDAE